MACSPVRLLRPGALQIDATTPCVLEINMPIPLPYRLDPLLPAPPYILDDRNDNDNGNGNDAAIPDAFRDTHVQPLVRRLIPQIAAHLFGSDSSDSDPDHPGQLLSSWDASIARDKQHDFDFTGCGWWRDHFGVEHRGPVHAYNEFADAIEVLHAFRFYLVRGVADAAALRASNPRVLRLDVVEGDAGGCGWRQQLGREGGVAFEVKEYTEAMRRTYVNPIVAWLMEEGEKDRALGAWEIS
ncbi:hypothetical protein F5144DRAFT_572305 [Chaetomium tenue]|uniref:Uncharacterized protein n=1 Tax=Chaetomium tenue TaxID=1854479 RepID=A0ACB7P8N8_9PEZI|nr:hypothetical protein F5144DRAFT_572305 [Chaetomium globosum]